MRREDISSGAWLQLTTHGNRPEAPAEPHDRLHETSWWWLTLHCHWDAHHPRSYPLRAAWRPLHPRRISAAAQRLQVPPRRRRRTPGRAGAGPLPGRLVRLP